MADVLRRLDNAAHIVLRNPGDRWRAGRRENVVPELVARWLATVLAVDNEGRRSVLFTLCDVPADV